MLQVKIHVATGLIMLKQNRELGELVGVHRGIFCSATG